MNAKVANTASHKAGDGIAGPRPDVRAPTFHDDDADSLPGYHTLSVLALVSLAFGLAAPICFTAPVMMAVPLFGAAISLVALRRIAISEGALAGRWAASAGLALCVASLLALFGYSQVKRWLQVAQAAEFGQSWLTRVAAGDMDQAFRLTAQGAEPRAPAGTEPGEPAANPYDDFLANPAIRLVAFCGAGSQVRFEETLDYEGRPRGTCIIQQRFSVRPSSSASNGTTRPGEPVAIDLRLQRARLPRELYPRWLVVGYASQNAAGNGHSHDDNYVH